MSVRVLLAVRRPDGQLWYVATRTGDFALLAGNIHVRVPVRELEWSDNGDATASLPIEWVKRITQDEDEETSDDDGDGEGTGRPEHHARTE